MLYTASTQALPATWKCPACGNKTTNAADECSGCGREREVPRNQPKVCVCVCSVYMYCIVMFYVVSIQHCDVSLAQHSSSLPRRIVANCFDPSTPCTTPQHANPLDINNCSVDDIYQACMLRFHFAINHVFQNAGIRVVIDQGKLTMERDVPNMLAATRSKHHATLKRMVSMLQSRSGQACSQPTLAVDPV